MKGKGRIGAFLSSPSALFALFLLLLAVVYADPLFLRKNFAGRDPLGYHYPVEKAVHDAYARGRLPVWMPEISGGRPLVANPNVGALYPIRPALAWLPFPVSIRIFPVLHWLAAGTGFLLLLLAIGLSRSAAWIGAVTYVFSAVSVSEVFYPNIHPGMALLPWVLWALASRRFTRVGKALVLSLLFALLIFAGDVFTIALALLAAGLWVLLEEEQSGRVGAFGLLALALTLAALLAAPQILAAALWIPETNRAVLGIRLEEALLFSLSPFRLLELLIPYPFGPTWEVDHTRMWGFSVLRGKAIGFFSSLYPGALPLIAVFATWRIRAAAGARFARILFLVGVALSVLPGLIPSGWSSRISPLPLRYPEKFAVAIALAMAILAALAFERFRRFPFRPRSALTLGVLLAILALLVALFPEPAGRFAVRLIGGDARLAARPGEVLPWALAEAGLFWMATLVALDLLARGSLRAVLVSVALLTAVPIAANRRIAQTFYEEDLFAPTPFVRFLRGADPGGSFRTLGESPYLPQSRLEEAQLGWDVGQVALARRSWDMYTHALWDRGTVFNLDFDLGDFSRIESLRKISFFAAGYRDSQAFFGSFALRWGIRIRDQDPLPGYRRIGGDGLQDWDEHESAYPAIRLAEHWWEEKGAVTALQVLPKLGNGEIVVESGSQGEGRARPGQLRVLEKSPERLLIEIATPDPTWLFLLRAFWTHRTVLLDGKPVEDAPAQLAFSAVRVPAGRHRVAWTEEIPGGEVSRWGPVAYAMIALGFLFVDLRRRRR